MRNSAASGAWAVGVVSFHAMLFELAYLSGHEHSILAWFVPIGLGALAVGAVAEALRLHWEHAHPTSAVPPVVTGTSDNPASAVGGDDTVVNATRESCTTVPLVCADRRVATNVCASREQMNDVSPCCCAAA